MKSTSILRWIKGYVTVEVRGDSSSAFLSFLASMGITVEKVKRKRDSITFIMKLDDYKRIRSQRHKFKNRVKLRHISFIGLPAKLLFLSKRKSLAVGLTLFLLVIYSFSQFIWKIEIKGNETIGNSEIISAYTELGIKNGMPKRALDSYAVRDRFTLKLGKVSWCSFNLEGSVLTVNITEVRESDKASRLSHSNLIAERDGIIKKIDAVSGYTKVRVGDVVGKGDILISGAPEAGGGFTWSKGEIIAETERTFKIEIPKRKETVTFAERNEKRSVLSVFGLEIPLYLDNIHYDFIVEKNTRNFRFFGEEIPISLITATFSEVSRSECEIGAEEAKNNAVAALLDSCKNEEIKALEILEIKSLETDSSYVFTYRCKCLEDIAQINKINVAS